MKRSMRHVKQAMTESDSMNLLRNAFYGVLSTISEDGTPYGVPLNHVLEGNKLYFHGAVSGHKLDNILLNPQACFTVVGETKMLPEKYTAHFKSVIAFGKIRRLEDPEAIRGAVRLLCEKTMPEHMKNVDKVITAHLPKLCAFEMEIEHLTGKESED